MARQRGAVGAAVLLGLLVLAVTGGADEAAAVKMVEKLGGKVWRDDKLPGKAVLVVNLIGTKVADAGLKELRELKSLQTLNLHGTNVTDAGLRELKGLKSLQSLNLSYTNVTDGGLKELKELKTL